MQYRAAIFDIDGTLVHKGEKAPSAALQNAIMRLQAQGVTVIIATGRAHFSARAVLGDLRPDYLVATNGSYIADGDGRILFETRLDEQQMYALVDYCEDYELPLEFAFADGYYIYVEHERFKANYGNYAGVCNYMMDGEDQTRHLQDMPFGACVQAAKADVDALCAKLPELGLRFVPFGNGLCWDVFCQSMHKAKGLCQLLNRLGIAPAQAVAFGDGENDIEMLREMGHGVRIGEGCADLRAVSDAAVAPDGLADYLNALFAQEATAGESDAL